MKITLCGSVSFAQQFVDVFDQLKKLGHEPLMHETLFQLAEGSANKLLEEISADHAHAKRKYGFIKWWHDCIMRSDAILVLNFDKNGIKNYIGGNTLMEMGFAHVNDKTIFLFNHPPEDVSYADEIRTMTDVVINGDLSKLS